MGKYFGTDGIRGKYGKNLDNALAFRVGAALARYFGKGVFVVGRDPRESGPAIEDAVIKGIYAAGGSVLAAGILPTPAIAFLVKSHGAAAGVVISASHNPPEYNGIKVFDGKGLKLSEAAEAAVEALIDSGEKPCAADFGKYTRLGGAEEQYIDYLTKQVPVNIAGLKVYLDCACGACGGGLARRVFERLGATVTAANDVRDGTRINENCGAVYPEALLEKMAGAGGNAIGFSFDGDGDRLAVVLGGVTLDGDTVLYNLATGMELAHSAVVGTILSNLALEEKFAAEGISFFRTPVGDKYIANKLFEDGFSLGGEQSGHYIINRGCLTGDAILSALYLLKALYRGGKLEAPRALELYPQKQESYPADESVMAGSDFKKLLKKSEERLGGSGRIIVRMSGTEPKIRIMTEARDIAAVEEIMRDFQEFFLNRGKKST